MAYISSIKTALFVFPLIALIFTIPFILYQYHKYGSINSLRVLIVYSFILYMITVYFLVILPLPKRNEVVYKPDMVKLVPFGFIDDIRKESSLVLNDPHTYLIALKEPCFYTVIFNIFMTIPFGIYLRYYFRCSFFKTIGMSFLLSLFFEVTQVTGLYFIYPYPYRVFDVDDLLTNTLGGLIGYYCASIFKKILPSREKIDESSYIAGDKVSGLRRVTLFCLDMSLYLILFLLMSIFIRIKYLVFVSFCIYYILLPCFLGGQTIGAKFLNVKMVYERYGKVKDIFRIIFLYLHYFIIPFWLFIGLFKILIVYPYYLLLCLIFVLFIFLYLLYCLFYLMKNNNIYYDKLFNVTYLNMIKWN